ncbi:MAG: 16S rRNA (cytosine(967)-C(5))-methyltransferase RsmB [Desulfocapsaceae bacterium]|nr:16S rRNA (cytosine(967)-C(5))-methyltransferase RsmB [Desulfocapsaceae bacterium]
MVKNNSRFIAITTLVQLGKKATPLPVLFQRICTRYHIDGNDRALAMNLIYGVLRQHQYLDLIISKLSRTPLKKMHPVVHQGLAVGLYQILFLDRIPDSAAVNETVKAIREARLPKRLHGFVNGVLRESIRQREQLHRVDEMAGNQPPVLNHPDWLTSRWSNNFGYETMVKICHHNNRQQPLTLRLNSLELNRNQYLELCAEKKIDARPCRFAPQGIILPDYQGPISVLPGYGKGWFQVQGEAAQLVTLLLQPFRQSGQYLDGCAGLGGKTGHLLELLAPFKAHLTAIEPESHRQEGLARTHDIAIDDGRLTLYKESLQKYSTHSTILFDGILLDVPCSGTGVIGRQPDIRWHRNSKDIANYASLQRQLLRTGEKLLKPGGTIVYATCSLEPEENIDIINDFLSTVPHFVLEDCTAFLPDSAASLIKHGCFQPLPTDGLDGFFGARLVRNPASD